MRIPIIISFLLITELLFAKPERLRVIICENPSTSVTIAWDQLSGTNPELFFCSDDYGNKVSLYQKKAVPTKSVMVKGMNTQFVRL